MAEIRLTATHLSTASQSRACLYGDGLFETLAFRDGQIQHWSDHWQRLKAGLIRLAYPPLSEQEIWQPLQQQLSHLDEDRVIRLSVSRSGQRGYRISRDAPCLIDIQTAPFPARQWHGKTIQARWCETRWAKQPLLAGIKHLNRLEQVMARSEWQDPSIEEGLVCDTDGYVISGTMSGLAWRVGKTIFAPDLTQTGIDSTARKRLLAEKAEQGFHIVIGYFLPAAVIQAEEVWVMNAIQGIAQIDTFLNDQDR